MQKLYKFLLPILGLLLFASSFIPSAKSQTNPDMIDNWWPVDNVRINNLQPFKAMLRDHDVNSYNMFWQVDNGRWNFMPNNYNDYPHKEADVDLSGWNWRGEGPYKISFIAAGFDGKIIAQKNINIYVPQGQNFEQINDTYIINGQPVQNQIADKKESLSNPQLYINPDSPAKRQAYLWRESRPQDAIMMDQIAAQPQGIWFGNWNADVFMDVNRIINSAQGKLPVFVLYNIPGRDCGGFSQGGLNDAIAYKNWISRIASAIGERQAFVILEPDATAQIDCLSNQDVQSRFDLLKSAVRILKSQSNALVYIDAGHPGWVEVSEMARRLKLAGIDEADGFALNVSNFFSTADNIRYGEIISGLVGGKHFVVDTGRNGLGAAASYEWCNPPGRALGESPTMQTGHSLVDAYLWIKVPGESDGTCNGGPPAGTWWPEYALGLIKRSGR